ncbi:MAG: D-alanine--D-alanine ligase [Desulfococcaceae bacterium]
MSRRPTIALLSGGISSEREVSLSGGDQVAAALNPEKYAIRRYDPRDDLPRLVADAPDIDVALIILHGPFGEDGTVQGLLDLLNIPYQGAGVLGSALAMNKLASKRLYGDAGLPVPPYRAVLSGAPLDFADLGDEIGLPLVVKPGSGGSSIGMSIVRRADDLEEALRTAFREDELVLLERFVSGTELTAGVIGNDELESLPLIEIVPKAQHDFFNYAAKYSAGEAEEICPARVPEDVAVRVQAMARTAHEALFCRGYSRSDFILSEADGELYLLETNTIPGMTPTSLFPQAARAAGMEFPDLLDRLIRLAMTDHAERSRRRPTGRG